MFDFVDVGKLSDSLLEDIKSRLFPQPAKGVFLPISEEGDDDDDNNDDNDIAYFDNEGFEIQEEEGTDGWEEILEEGEEDDLSHINWINNEDTRISMSFSRKYIAFARKDILLVSKILKKVKSNKKKNEDEEEEEEENDDDGDSSNHYNRNVAIQFDGFCVGEHVTSMMWMTCDSHHATSQGVLTSSKTKRKEYTILFVGSSHGILRFFSKKGKLLYEQQFHDSPILNIKCKPFIQMSGINDLDDILIIYPRIVVRIDHKSLSLYINRLMRGGINQKEDSTENEYNEQSQNNHFLYSKWFLSGQDKVNDAICYVEDEISPLDIFKTKPAHTLIAVGYNPVIATFASTENEQPSISASRIATEVASKVTSVMFSFAKNLIWGSDGEQAKDKAKKDQNTQHDNPPKHIQKKLSIDDNPREVMSISMDMTGRFAVTSDSLGRIMVIDIQHLVIIKVLKGYRNAKCGWYFEPSILHASMNPKFDESEESNNSYPNMGYQFVIVFAPLRGLLELWDIFDGKRVFAANVGTKCTLLHIPSLLSSATPNILNQNIKQSMISSSLYQQWVILTNDGKLKKIKYKLVDEHIMRQKNESFAPHLFNIKYSTSSTQSPIPMESVLTKSKSDADIASFRKFSRLMSKGNYTHPDSKQQMKSILSSIKEFTTIQQAFQLLDDSIDVTLVLELVQATSNQHPQHKYYFKNLSNLLKAYLNTMKLSKTEESEDEFEIIANEKNIEKYLSDWEEFISNDKMYKNLCKHFKFCHSDEEKVSNTFKGWSSFIDNFHIEEKQIEIKQSISKIHFHALSHFIFAPLLQSHPTQSLFETITLLGLPSKSLRDLFLSWFFDISVEEIMSNSSPIIYQNILNGVLSEKPQIFIHNIIQAIVSSISIPNSILLCLLCIDVVKKGNHKAGSSLKDLINVTKHLEDLLNIYYVFHEYYLDPRNFRITVKSLQKGQIKLFSLLAYLQMKHDGFGESLGKKSQEPFLVADSVQQLIQSHPHVVREGESVTTLLKFHCVQICIEKDKLDCAMYYLDSIEPGFEKASCALLHLDTYLTNDFSRFLDHVQCHRKFPIVSLMDSFKYKSVESFISSLKFVKSLLQVIRNSKIHQYEGQENEEGKQQGRSWIPRDTGIHDAMLRLEKRKSKISEDYIRNILSLILFFDVLYPSFISMSNHNSLPEVPLSSLFPDAILSSLITITATSTIQAAGSRSHSSRNRRTKQQSQTDQLIRNREVFLNSLLPTFYHQAIELCATAVDKSSHEQVAFPNISRDYVHIEFVKYFYLNDNSGIKQSQVQEAILKIQHKAKASSKFVLEIATPKMSELVQQLSSDKKTVSLLSEMNPDLFQWVTHYSSSPSSRKNSQKSITSMREQVKQMKPLLSQCLKNLHTKRQQSEHQICTRMIEFINKLS